MSNARLTMLVNTAIGQKGAELLWVPPSLPYYQLEEPFASMENFTKTLLFSAWVMVPRVIGTLLSYEVERRTIGDPRTRETHEKEVRKYFTSEKRRRHPVPQIRFSLKGNDFDAQMRNMSNFCLLYPSITLAQVVDPVVNIRDGRPLDELRTRTAEVIQQHIRDANLEQYSTRGGDSERWYWAAPLLLDRANDQWRSTLEEWFRGNEDNNEPWNRETYFRGATENASAKERHAKHLLKCFDTPEAANLGPLPDNLAPVMADLALGSPAVLTLRSLQRMFPESANQIAWSKRSTQQTNSSTFSTSRSQSQSFVWQPLEEATGTWLYDTAQRVACKRFWTNSSTF